MRNEIMETGYLEPITFDEFVAAVLWWQRTGVPQKTKEGWKKWITSLMEGPVIKGSGFGDAIEAFKEKELQ